MSAFDLDAAIGELADKPLTYKGKTFTLPAELPGGVLTPFLADDLGLIDLVVETLTHADDKDAEGNTKSVWDLLEEALRKQPKLPAGLIDAGRDALAALFGAEQWAEFQTLRPSVTAYTLILRGIATEYGMGLADFFGSDESSDTAGDDSKETSTSTTDSTPEASSATPDTQGSSDSDAS